MKLVSENAKTISRYIDIKCEKVVTSLTRVTYLIQDIITVC